MTYIIEGTVTEISSNGTFKIAGSEGYALKHSDKKYNVLCPDKMPKEIEVSNAIIIPQEHQFIMDKDTRDFLFNALGKRAKITVTVDETKKYVMSIFSITVIAN